MENSQALIDPSIDQKRGFGKTCALVFIHNLYASLLLSIILNCTCLNSVVLFSTGKWLLNLGEGDNVHEPGFVWKFWMISSAIIFATGVILAVLECRRFQRQAVLIGDKWVTAEQEGIQFRRYYVDTDLGRIRVSKRFWEGCDYGDEFVCGVTRKLFLFRIIFYFFYPATSCNPVSLWGPFDPVES